jgi:hypothetical protein
MDHLFPLRQSGPSGQPGREQVATSHFGVFTFYEVG